MDVIELFTEEVNFAVVRVPSRKYPGILIQGDTLSGFISTISEIRSLVKTDPESAEEELSALYDELNWRLVKYKEHSNKESMLYFPE